MCRLSNLAHALCAAVLFIQSTGQAQSPTTATCFMVTAVNISKGSGDFYLHYNFFNGERYTVKKGDVLDYDLYIVSSNPETTGGFTFDIRPDGVNPWVPGESDMRAFIPLDPSEAVGKWHHYRIPLDPIADHETRQWNVTFDGDKEGTYTQFIDNVIVTSADGKTLTLYDRGEPKIHGISKREGYSIKVMAGAVPRDEVKDGADLTGFISDRTKRQQLLAQANDLKGELDALKTADADTRKALAPSIRKLEQITSVSVHDPIDSDKFIAALHETRGPLRHLHEKMKQYSGYLIGHAHIDYQWLWEWPETLIVCRDTFGQAVKFMEEFPGFTFTQSSSSLYEATEKAWPDVFKKMQEFVAKGQWELAGGRVCEGDTFMISPESHARHFLYGQRYYRERFNGKQAIVGWEPDTFGHTWSMPQILLNGGCKYYYFCRGGHGKPLFWWEGPDGSRVLAFEEPATGSWYNSDVSYKKFEEVFKFEKNNGSKDMLWVYGLGNHGGGPTREYIETAREWQQKDYVPQVKFSTATDFFKALEKYDLSKIPVVKTELNTTSSSGFFGCFTTHGDIKRWNRDAEAVTESAEAIAFIASRFGFEYPGAEFRRNWEDITWNHHHDTLPGTSIHPSYNKSEEMYRRVIESSRSIGETALHRIAQRTDGIGSGVVVFNPVGFRRSGTVEFTIPEDADDGELVAVAGKSRSRVQRLEGSDDRAVFFAEGVPSMGYRRYEIKSAGKQEPGKLKVSKDGTRLENAQFSVVIDPAKGVVTSIRDKRSGRESIIRGGSGNRLEMHMEAHTGMSAWMIGKIREVKRLEDPITIEVVERGPARVAVKWTRKYEDTDLVQTVSLNAAGPPEFALDTQWKILGSKEKGAPFLKVAFDINAPGATQTYEMPFGSIVRPANGQEYPALKWVDSSSGKGGAALINDCKHGYSAEKDTLRLSLIRSSYYPDERPNERPQSMRWSFIPHGGDWKKAGVHHHAQAFNHPLWAVGVERNSAPDLPLEMSFLSASADNILVTGVKKAEDSSDMVVRYYEAFGREGNGKIDTAFETGAVKKVNFLEDEAEDQEPVAAVRPYEIRTLKIAVSGLSDKR